MRHFVGRMVASAVLASALVGCGPNPVADPLAVMLDRERDPVQRLTAAKQIGELSELSDPRPVVKAMHRVLWSDAQPTALRLWSMDQLIAYNSNAFWVIAKRRIREVDLWEVLGPMIDRAVQAGDAGFTPALVRSYARTSQVYPDDARPEAPAIVALNPGLTLGQAVWRALDDEDTNITTAARVDAWTLYHRLMGAERARQALDDSVSEHPLVLDLKSTAWLDVLPSNRETVLWLMQLRGDSGGDYLEKAKHLVHRLSESQRKGLELRHLPVLLAADDSVLLQGRSALRARVARRLSGAKVTARIEPGIAMRLPSESLNDHVEALSFSDLATIDLLMDAMADRALVATLFEQADRDLADPTTEHGGVLAVEDGTFMALPFMSSFRSHDRKFYSSEALVQRMYTGLAHYHFHAQSYDNAAYAGPGAGDLGFVDRLRPNAVVLTFLDRDTLGVDYYQPGGVVIDLGTIRR